MSLVFGPAPSLRIRAWSPGSQPRRRPTDPAPADTLPPGHGPCVNFCPAEGRKSLRAVPCQDSLLLFFTFKRNSTIRPGPFMAWCSCLLLEGECCKIDIAVRLRVAVALLRCDGLLWF